MPILSSNSNYQWILSLKIFLISTGVLSMAVFLKLSVPLVADFLVSEIPSIWTCFISWLRPPYLYLVINCIIISIVASSKLQQKLEDGESVLSVPETLAPPPLAKISSESDYVVCGGTDILNGYCYNNANQNAVTKIADLQIDESNGVYGRMMVEPGVSEMEKKGENDSLILTTAADETAMSSPMTNALHRKDSVGLLFSNEKEKPPVSSRIGQRKLVKASPEGKPLGVSKPKRQDTLESTWRTITEGRSMPLTRHLRKSDTWESQGRRANMAVDPATPPSKVMTKSETFKDRSNVGSPSPSPGGSGRLKREPSLTQEELNRRVEAFIKKFNDEMRLQRQESLKQYQEMVGSRAN
ncbi:uncharacterized protein LOC111798557 [Cucurbita pepo subsp. pepo]|uniref:uncharacterized protein LOC111798557 n=1 Tax=Cucurbita pepo subsp. pepo TaxID=3664 RepID=UPI000C9D3751|nr:uncharacterized protein LOC111798557 [Cucurbita pepo subsp. pepo]